MSLKFITQSAFWKRHFWLLWIGVIAMIGLGPLLYGWIQVWAHGGRGLAPYLSIDDLVYDQLMSAGQWCIHNHSSALADGGCRVRPIWWLGGKLDFGYVGLGSLVLRIVLLIAFIGAVARWTMMWARRQQLDSGRARTAMIVLMTVSPLPLVIFGSIPSGWSEFSFLTSLEFSPPNLLSYILYVVSCGGLYLTLNRPQWWPIWGIIAGAWGINHPYYLLFCISLFGCWIVQMGRPTVSRIFYAAGLIVPVLLAGGYYFWLSRVNDFFAFHLTSNQTRGFAVGLIVIGVALAIYSALIWLMRKRSQIPWQLDRFLVSWTALAIVWQYVPSDTQRRLILVLGFPLAIIATQAWLGLKPRQFTLRLVGGLVIASNLALLGFFVLHGQRMLYHASIDRYVITSADISYEQQIARRYPDAYFIADDFATKRLFPVGGITILNSHIQESPDYAKWGSVLDRTARGDFPCSSLTESLQHGQVTGAIIAAANPAKHTFERCGYTPAMKSDGWSTWLTPKK